MNFDNILGHQPIKDFLIKGISQGRIAHAQLFVGAEGIGVLPMAIAYATELICSQENKNAREKCNELVHPDMHFVFPTSTTPSVKENPVSSLFMEQWREFVAQSPYGSSFDWLMHLGIEKKKATINVHQAKEIIDALALKSFQGSYKVMIIWQVEKMNVECANKILKLLEEPPAQTVFILITHDRGAVLETIASRCQEIHFNSLPSSVIEEGLQKKGISVERARAVAFQAQGNFQKALQYAFTSSLESSFEERFVMWVRAAFKAKKNPASIYDLISWSADLSTRGREEQLQFLEYCSRVFRQAMLWNYGAKELVHISFFGDFKLERFAPYVHHNNINEIHAELEKAMYHIERNGAGKPILTDLSIKLTRLLHAKM